MADATKTLTDSAVKAGDHVDEHHSKVRGFDWKMVLIVLLVAFLLGIFLMFIA